MAGESDPGPPILITGDPDWNRPALLKLTDGRVAELDATVREAGDIVQRALDDEVLIGGEIHPRLVEHIRAKTDEEVSPITPPYWTEAGSYTWGLVVDGRIVGLVYLTVDNLGEEGPGGEPLLLELRWSWVRVDDPDKHHLVEGAPDLTGDLSHEEIAAGMDGARAVAAEAILGEQGRA